MKTIVIFTSKYFPSIGGIEIYTYNLAKYLNKLGNKVIIVTSKYYEEQEDIEEDKYVAIYRLPTLNTFLQRYPITIPNKKCKELLNLVFKENIDSVIIQTRFQIMSYIGAKFAKKHKIPVCVIEHTSSHFTVNNNILDFLGEKYEHFITNSIKKKVKDYYGVSKKCNEWLEHFGINAKGIFYGGVDLEEAEKALRYLKKDNNKIVITYVGRMIKEKGALELLEAFKMLKIKYENIELHLAGDGPILKDIINNSINEKDIFIHGNMKHENIINLLERTNIFVNPSYFAEGGQLTLYEAGIMKCAIVSTKVGVAKEIILDNETGLICTNEVNNIVEKVECLINNREKMITLGDNIYKVIKQGFTWDKATEKIFNTISYK